MRLDERIKQAIMDLINSKHPEWVHQEEIYTYLENELEFDERQKALHHQKAGQIEPNWQHDARNLQHSLKRNGTIINPRTDVYGLPMFEFELDYEAVWRGCLRNAESNPSCQIEPDLIIYDGVKITKSLVIERVQHLVNCGGVLPRGQVHKWHQREQIILNLCDEIETTSDGIVVKKIISRKGEFHAPRTLHNQEIKAAAAVQRNNQLLYNHNQDRQVKGMFGRHRRTIPRHAIDNVKVGKVIDKSKADNKERYALDKADNRVYIRDNPRPGTAPGYRCPDCKVIITARALNSYYVVPHWGHTEDRPHFRHRNCSFYTKTSNSLFEKYLDDKKQQRARKILDIKLEKRGFSGWGAYTIGDGHHGFPVTENNHNRILAFENLDPNIKSKINNRSFALNPAPSIRVIDYNISGHVSFTARENINSLTYNLRFEAIKSNQIFILDGLEKVNNLERLRPSSQYPLTADSIHDVDSNKFIAISKSAKWDSSNTAPMPEEQLTIDSQLVMWIYNLQNNNHVRYLSNFHNLSVKRIKDKSVRFDVLVQKPIEAHPINPTMIFLNDNETAKVIVNHSKIDDDNGLIHYPVDMLTRPSMKSKKLPDVPQYVRLWREAEFGLDKQTNRQNIAFESRGVYFQDFKPIPYQGITVKSNLHKTTINFVDEIAFQYSPITEGNYDQDYSIKVPFFAGSDEIIILEPEFSMSFNGSFAALADLQVFSFSYKQKDGFVGRLGDLAKLNQGITQIRNLVEDNLVSIEIKLDNKKTQYAASTLPTITLNFSQIDDARQEREDKLRLAREEARRIEEEKIREQKRLEAERLEAERVREEERIREQKKREQERLEAENKRRQEIHDKRVPILQDKFIGDMILAKKNFASKLTIAIIAEIDHDDFNTLKVYFIDGPKSLDKLLTVSWHEVGNNTWTNLNTDQRKLIFQTATISELILSPNEVKPLTQKAIEAFEKNEVAILNKVDTRENAILARKLEEQEIQKRLEQEEKEARDNRLSVYENCEIGYIVACKKQNWLHWEFGYLDTKGKKKDGTGIKVIRPKRLPSNYDRIRELTEDERDKVFRTWQDKPRAQFLDLFLEKERLAAIQAEAAEAERERREKEKARKAAEKRASIELKDKINKAKQSLSKPSKPKIASSRSTKRRDVPFNPFADNALEMRNRRQAEKVRDRRRGYLEDIPKKEPEKLSKTPKTTNKKTKPKLTQEEIDAVKKKARDNHRATEAQKTSVIKKTNSAKPLKSSSEIEKLKESIEIDEAMINTEQRKIDSKNSTKTVISNARSLKSRYAKRLREKKAKLDKLLKELDENND